MSIGLRKQTAASVPTPPVTEENLFIDSADDKLKKKIDTGAVIDLETAAAGVTTFEGRSGAVVSQAGDYNASEITNTPAGDIVATNVQAAINELDTEKLTVAHKGAGGVSEHPIATGADAGFMSPSDFTKLAGIAAGATANFSNAFLLSRANHTGTQTAATISDFNTEADARADLKILDHVSEPDPHAQYALDSDVTAAQAYAVQRSNHTGTQLASTISDFTAAAKSAAVQDAISDGITDIAPSQNAVFDGLANKSNVGHTHVAANVTDFTAAARTAVVTDAINDGVTDKAPSENAVFDALALKLDDPMTTAGDIIIRNAANSTVRLPSGGSANEDYILSLDSNGVPLWREENLGQDFGDGSDGNLTVTGALTLNQITYYNVLTVDAGAVINTNGFPLYCKVLDLSNAPAGAIIRNGNAGNSSATNTGAAGGGALAGAVLGGSGAGSTGAGGVPNNGVQAGAPTNQSTANGGAGGASGASGAGGTGLSAAGAAGAIVSNSTTLSRFEYQFIRGATQITGGAGGRGGSSGGGDGANSSRGAGGGGSGGGVMSIYAKEIITSVSTPASVIQARGGAGGTQINAPSLGNCGGASGAGGGGGGYIYLAYLSKTGPVVADLLDASGGNGGNGSNALGTGIGGNGGTGGSGGVIQIFNASNNAGTRVVGVAGSVGSVGVGLVGGTGGNGGAALASL